MKLLISLSIFLHLSLYAESEFKFGDEFKIQDCLIIKTTVEEKSRNKYTKIEVLDLKSVYSFEHAAGFSTKHSVRWGEFHLYSRYGKEYRYEYTFDSTSKYYQDGKVVLAAISKCMNKNLLGF